jgi:uncharacterized repeat protein (TIGR03803 family)
MKRFYGLIGACLSAALLSACGGNSFSALAPASVTPRIAAPLQPRIGTGYKSIYSFKSGKYGNNPQAVLLAIKNTLYGTTYYGGTGGDGTVFSVTTSGQERVLHSFKRKGYDGLWPAAGLLKLNGMLYGTTTSGTAGYGTVFRVSPSGSETVLYSFKGTPDGDGPIGGLISVNGELYGTTEYGGSGTGSTCGPPLGCGTVFELSTSGVEQVLYNFQGGASDGSFPLAGLTAVNDTLYGTTGGSGFGADVGTVFSVTASGEERVLYSFKGIHGDGANPMASLINVNGMLYGTTRDGGAHNNGTVFSVTTAGLERVLHSFKGGSDGAHPYAELANLNGKLYGTTHSGGSYSYGTVFSITTSGAESVLHSFSGTQGAYPEAGLIGVKGTLYGTTAYGGSGCRGGNPPGCGTVFAITP